MRSLARLLPDRVWPLVQLAVALGLLMLLWHTADGPEAARSLASADWSWLVLAIAALTVQTVLSALRWQLTARQLGVRFDARYAIREYYLAQVVNQALPGGMIGDAGRAYRARAQAGLMASGQAVVFERLAGQIAMYLIFAAAFLVTSLVPGGLDWPGWLLAPVTFILLTGLVLPAALLAATQIPGRAGGSATRLWRAIGVALADRRVLPGQVALGIGTTLCNLAAFALCARAVGVELHPSVVAALVPLILFTMLIPISISGWGFREGAAAAVLPLAGATASDGLASSVAFGLAFIAAVLPGLAFLWLKPPATMLKT